MARRIALKTTLVTGLLTLSIAASAGATPVVTVQNGNDAGAGSLREAIKDVDSGGMIVIPASVGTISLASQLKIERSMTIEGAGAAQTTIDAGPNSRGFFVSGAPTVTIEGVQVANGSLETAGPAASGAGIDQVGGSLTVADSLIVGNKVDTGAAGTSHGGGIAAEAGATSLTLRNTIVSDNVIIGQNDRGAGVFVEGPSLMVEGGSIKGNTSEGQDMFGGGLYFKGTKASLSHVSITGNEVRTNTDVNVLGEGGGLAIQGGTGNTLEGLTIAGNRVVMNQPGAEGDFATHGGGGVIGGTGTAIVNTTVSGNTVTESIKKDGHAYGGGLFTGETVRIVNSTLAANTVNGEGEAVTTEGGDLYAVGKVEVENSIFAEGAVRGGGQNCAVAPAGELISLGGNIDSFIQCGFGAPGDRSSIDPGVGPLGENGGPVETMALLPGSPAIDAATAAGCPATDARGVLRPAGAACDIGAFEVATPSAVTEAAGDVGPDRAALTGVATNPDLAGGTVAFQYGTGTGYGSVTAAQSIGPTTRGAPFSVSLTGLKPGATYHYRILVTNAVGTAAGADRTFTTQSPPAVVPVKEPPPRVRASLSIKRLAGLRFRVHCASAPCIGKVVATARSGKHTVVVATAKLRLAAGATKKLSLRLSRAGKRLVAPPGRLSLVVKASLAGGKGSVPRPLRFKLR
ncbi:MAG TPA: fibronectin type III domain-containing protein [Solirubrobacterales bacterium]|jgi:hypothetical protein